VGRTNYSTLNNIALKYAVVIEISMRFIIIFMSVAIVFSVASLHANEAKKDSRSNNCRLISEELNSRLETISKIKSSLETLLGNSSSFEMPIEVVFQVNLNSPEKIEKRI
jgi:hypothetical protein